MSTTLIIDEAACLIDVLIKWSIIIITYTYYTIVSNGIELLLS